MESSILESIGHEIIGVMSPVSICMFLVVLLVYSLSPSNPFSSSPPPIRTAANLVYLENPSDTTTQKIEGSLLNALVFVILIALVTFLLVILYYFKFNNFLKNYTRFSAFFVLGTMGGSIFLSIIQHFSIPIDSITCFLLLFNFTIVGVLSVFSVGFPIILRQCYMVSLGIFVAAWFTKLPEWTTWTLLVALALYDVVAVLAPGGPLKLLVHLASTRDEELPALIYEARPVAPQANREQNTGLFLAGFSDSSPSASSVELQPLAGDNTAERSDIRRNGEARTGRDEGETSPLVGSTVRPRHSSGSDSSEYSVVALAPAPEGTRSVQFGNTRESEIGETSPLVEIVGAGSQREQTRTRDDDDDEENDLHSDRGIRLGLGDFVFYSVLVGRAAMYDLMTVYACYLAIVSGLGCTLILLSVCRRALPALPISIALGVMFYFLTRLLMEPFVVGAATHLMMF